VQTYQPLRFTDNLRIALSVFPQLVTAHRHRMTVAPVFAWFDRVHESDGADGIEYFADTMLPVVTSGPSIPMCAKCPMILVTVNESTGGNFLQVEISGQE